MYWRKLLLSLSGYEMYMKSCSNIPHNQKVIQHAIFNKDFAHSVSYTLEYIEFTDYQNLDNKQLEEVLQNTKKLLMQFSKDFSKLFFSYT